MTKSIKDCKGELKGELNMKRQKAMILKFCITIMLLILSATGLHAQEQEIPFPQYGTGPIHVFIYSNYSCPPCRDMEPAVDPILHDLLKRDAITLTLVDIPYSENCVLCARYFLYALKKKNDVDHAFFVKGVLFNEKVDKQTTTKARFEALFKSKGIPFEVFDSKPVFDRYNALIKKDKVKGTPTCVIVKDGKKEKFIGGPDIIAALKRLL
jgi:thiol-disulfide isomerase/thioredoxin